MTVRIDALTRNLVPQQNVTWWLLDINTLQYNVTGAFTLVLPATPANWALVTFDGSGEFIPVAFLVDWNGVFQVPLMAEQWEHDLTVDPNTGIITETITFSGADFTCLLSARVCFPRGTSRWAAQGTVPRVVTGPAETVIKTLVTENMVTCGDSARVVPDFTVAADLGRGGTVTYTISPPLPSGQANLLTGDSTGFEGSLGTWQPGLNCTIARTNARSHQSSYAMQMTASGTGDMTAVSCPAGSITTDGFAVRPGDSVSVSAWVRAASTTETCNAGCDWYDITGTYLSTSYATGQSDSNTGWNQVSGNVAAPDGAVYASVTVKVQNCTGGEVHYVDDVAITDGGGGFPTGRYVASLGPSLMDMVRSVAAQSDIGVSITLSGGNLVFDCYLPRDLSAKAVFSTSLGNLRGDTIADAIPAADAVLMEDGLGSFTEHDAAGSAAADPWRRTELFDDQTSTTTASDLATQAASDLATGASVHQLVITATDIPLLRFGNDAGPVQGFLLGDTVTVAIRPGVSYTDIVSAVQLTAGSGGVGNVYTGSTTGVQAAGGYGTYYEIVTPTIGTSGTDQTAVSRLASQVRRIDQAVARARKAGQ
jgi:hypothetical protein